MYNQKDTRIRAVYTPFFIMRYYQHKLPDEIAKELGMKTNAVKVRLTRLKSKVKKLVQKDIGES